MRSFWRLHTERQVGMGPGPIPHSACEDYARRRGLCEELVDHFCDVIRAMDDAYLGWGKDRRPELPPSEPPPGQTVDRGRGT